MPVVVFGLISLDVFSTDSNDSLCPDPFTAYEQSEPFPVHQDILATITSSFRARLCAG